MRGGINVAPIMVENQIGQVEGVADVAVVGVPDAFWGEVIVACVIPARATDPRALERSIYTYAARSLDANLRPDRVVTMARFPRTGTGKVQKQALRDQLMSRPQEQRSLPA